MEALFSLILVAGTAMTYLSIHTIMQQTEIQNVSKVNRTRRVYEQKKFAKRNRKGFTIVEVVVALVVMGLMLLTIQIVMPLLNHQQSDDLAWHYALAEIEQNNEAFKITQVRRNRLKLEGRKGTKPYLLLQNKQSLILSTPEGGYVLNGPRGRCFIF